jgi:histidinol dehydrogenase
MRVLNRARDQISEFHKNQIEKPWGIYKENGVMLGQLVRPIERVALYVPGGTAAYPSTMLMNAVPAKLAGVEELAIFTPAKADGKVADVILAAAYCCGISTVYKVGGAQAIAAAAYGAGAIPKFDKIVGPGNIYVATAKRLVYGEVAIDMIAGPSEVLVIADETADPKDIAADLLSQAEHDVLASSILVTTSESIVAATEKELEKQLELLPRKEFAEKSLKEYGAAILVKDLDEAFEVSNGIAPEHLEIMTINPLEKLPLVKNAGSVFLGENTPEPLGDYMSGTNHVLPTGGTARFYSPLGVYDFIKRTAYSYYPREALRDFKDDVIKFAELEGLNAHANSIRVRFED